MACLTQRKDETKTKNIGERDKKRISPARLILSSSSKVSHVDIYRYITIYSIHEN